MDPLSIGVILFAAYIIAQFIKWWRESNSAERIAEINAKASVHKAEIKAGLVPDGMKKNPATLWKQSSTQKADAKQENEQTTTQGTVTGTTASVASQTNQAASALKPAGEVNVDIGVGHHPGVDPAQANDNLEDLGVQAVTV
jgi:hypothetical protein